MTVGVPNYGDLDNRSQLARAPFAYLWFSLRLPGFRRNHLVVGSAYPVSHPTPFGITHHRYTIGRPKHSEKIALRASHVHALDGAPA
jgi:hypothetical protein